MVELAHKNLCKAIRKSKERINTSELIISDIYPALYTGVCLFLRCMLIALMTLSSSRARASEIWLGKQSLITRGETPNGIAYFRQSL